jgi:hypothetical protein
MLPWKIGLGDFPKGPLTRSPASLIASMGIVDDVRERLDSGPTSVECAECALAVMSRSFKRLQSDTDHAPGAGLAHAISCSSQGVSAWGSGQTPAGADARDSNQKDSPSDTVSQCPTGCILCVANGVELDR